LSSFSIGVRDFDAWKPVFDVHGDIRRKYGATGHEIYRGREDPNEITVVNHSQKWPAEIGQPLSRLLKKDCPARLDCFAPLSFRLQI